MSNVKPTNEPKPKADDLIKTGKDAKVELTEEELKRVSGGATLKADMKY
jgi:bacteriocin-like protein